MKKSTATATNAQTPVMISMKPLTSLRHRRRGLTSAPFRRHAA